MTGIERARIGVATLPLVRPYVLSFVTLDKFVAYLVEVVLEDGSCGTAEAVALPGYGRETDQEMCRCLMSVLSKVAGRSVEEARELAEAGMGGMPFGRSAVMTALALASGDFHPPSSVDWPLVGTITTAPPEQMIRRCRDLAEQGYRTVKVKIGRDVEADIRGAASLLEEDCGELLFRFDANQAYDEAAARRFLASLDGPGRQKVELVEQPLPAEQWRGMEALAVDSPVPLMLDESVWGPSDVRRAADAGAAFVKLKLCKHRGPDEVLELAREARRLGMRVVLGNGVATDVGNLTEAWTYAAGAELFHGAGECNGFARLKRCLLVHPPALREGRLVWTAQQADPLLLNLQTVNWLN